MENEISELFSVLTRQQTYPLPSAVELLGKICPGTTDKKDKSPKRDPNINNNSTFTDFAKNDRLGDSITKQDLLKSYNQAVSENTIQERLFHIFYNLDEGKKGYLSAEDVRRLFKIYGKQISLVDVQNSFQYAKLPQNRMSFEDFKDHFYKF